MQTDYRQLYFELYQTNGAGRFNVLYMRKDLLVRYLQHTKQELVWTTWVANIIMKRVRRDDPEIQSGSPSGQSIVNLLAPAISLKAIPWRPGALFLSLLSAVSSAI
jgi:hypothetical protein